MREGQSRSSASASSSARAPERREADHPQSETDAMTPTVARDMTDRLSKEEETVLMARIAAGDNAAAAEAVSRYAGPLYAIGRRLLSDAAEAEDVAQEAMLRLWRIAPEWRSGEARISTWLHRVASNLCFDRLRKRRTTDLDEAPEQIDESLSAQAQLEARDDVALVRAALNALPDRQRAAIMLRHFEDRSNPEIAETLGVSVEAVESLLSRGRRALKGLIAGEGGRGED